MKENKYTTIILSKERKELIHEAKKKFVIDRKLSKLSDSKYIVELIEFYNDHN